MKQIIAALRLLGVRLSRKPLIVVRRYGGIGDVLCSLPAVAALRRRNPGAFLLYITSSQCAELLQLSGVPDAVLSSSTRGLSRLLSVFKPAEEHLLQLPDELDPPLPRPARHLREEFAHLLGVPPEELRSVRLNAPQDAVRHVDTWIRQHDLTGKRLIVAHAGPTWKVKEWPQASWNALVAKMQSLPGTVVIQAGTDQHADVPGARAIRIAGALDAVGHFNLVETLALLTRSSLCVGVDSGLLHLAGAVGTPCLGFFGPTLPECFLPDSATASRAQADVPCLGCHHLPTGPGHWKSGCPYDIRCMTELTPDAVFERCLDALGQAPLARNSPCAR